MRRRPKLIIGRWTWIFFLATFSAIVCWFCTPLLHVLLATPASEPDSIWWFTGLGLILLTFLNIMAGFRAQHLITIAYYPSFLTAAFIASFAVDKIFDVQQALGSPFGIGHIFVSPVVYLVSLVLAVIWNKMTAAPKFDDKIARSTLNLTAEEGPSPKEIIDWAASETPILNPEDDLLNSEHRINRIINSLAKNHQNTVAVLGAYGSGKTSLANLVTGTVESKFPEKFIFASASCWGFNDSNAAQEAVLEQIILALSEHVDTFAIRGMPSRFVEALSDTSPYIRTFFNFASTKDPDSQLDLLSPLLGASGKTLVVIIEDTERNGKEFDLECIEGLLVRFKHIPDLSFIINASLDSQIDFMRLCEHTEVLANLDSVTVMNTLEKIQVYCRNQYPEDVDLVERKPYYGTEPWKRANMWELQLVDLINTPRKLKATIRRVINAWDSLHGEVEIDQLLIASCLRVCAPKAFSYLIRRHGDFASIGKDLYVVKYDPETDPVVRTLKEEWTALRDPSFDHQAAARLLKVLVGDQAEHVFVESVFTRNEWAQCFEYAKCYRERIFNEAIMVNSELDQGVLKEVRRAKLQKDFVIVGKQLVDSEAFFTIFDRFRRRVGERFLEKGELLATIKEFFASMRNKYGRLACDENEPCKPVASWVPTCFEMDISESYEAAFEIVRKSLKESPRLAADIYHLLISQSSTMSAHQNYAIKAIQALRDIYEKDGYGTLDSAFDETMPEALNRVVKAFTPLGSNGRPDWQHWDWLGPILLKAVRINHKKFAPQIAFMLGLTIGETQFSELPEGYLLNEEILGKAFNLDSFAIMSEMAKPFIINREMADSKANNVDFTLVNPRAKTWLDKNRDKE